MSIKAKQVAGVTTLVVVVVAVLSAYHMATLARLSLEETASRGEMLAQAVFQRARDVVGNAPSGTNPYDALREDGGVRSILESTVGTPNNVSYTAIVDANGAVVARFPAIELQPIDQVQDLGPIVDASPQQQLRAVYADRSYEIRQTMLAGTEPFATIRIGVSMLLVRSELQQAANRAATTVLAALVISSLVAMLLAQWMLRPIHVIQSGLTRLGRGELDVRLDLPEHEFRDLGSSFEAVSAQLSALGRSGAPATSQVEDGTARAGGPTDFESVMDNLEDAVALFSPAGELIFDNAAMTGLLNEIGADMHGGSTLSALAPTHPVRQLVEQTLAGRKSAGPMSFSIPNPESRAPSPEPRVSDSPTSAERRAPNADSDERLLMSHAIEDTHGRFLGAMLVARNLAYLTQVHSTLNYSRKLAALGRLMAGVAHEVKNPLNAMTIHLELLKQKLSRQAAVATSVVPGLATQIAGSGERTAVSDVAKHVTVISDEIRRLDQVVVGFLKFVRPEELKLQPVHLAALMSDVQTTVAPDAECRGITIKSECPDSLPEINADPGMLRQALLNLAINACHAMDNGGTLRLACRTTSRRRVEIDVEDNGIGIAPENLGRIFDLYFTTKERGSGIGLSMVYRIVQMHDGEVEVQSTPGAGTRFRLIFPQA